MATILIIEDDDVFGELLVMHLEDRGHEPLIARTLAQGRHMLTEHGPDAVLLDQQLPDGFGLSLLKDITAQRPHPPVIMITGVSDNTLAIEAMHSGAYDFIRKPMEEVELETTLGNALRSHRLSRQISAITDADEYRVDVGQIVGASPAILDICKIIGRVAASRAPVLITGESGTGKENEIRFIKYFSDFQFRSMSNLWDKLGVAANPLYVVQTNPLVVQRCLQMTTEPGDLVLDPNCGSGTTAYVAEQWGRRWITCDTSRVPLALARQRLLTAAFPWYELKEPQRGPAGGFVYQRKKQNRKGEEVGGLVPRITLKSIANDEEPETVTLVDKPEQNKKVTRVCGPFSVEATVQAAGAMLEEQDGIKEVAASYENPRAYLDRMIEVLRQSHTLRLPGNKALEPDQVRPLAAEDYEHLHAEAVEQDGEQRRIAVMFGPQDGAIDSGTVLEAAREAWYSKFDALYLFGFAIQAKARELVESHGKLKLPCTYVAVTPDVVMSDLLKTGKASEIFSITGLPDVDLKPSGDQAPDGQPLYQVELLGLDIFRPHDLETESIYAENLPCWMLDTDYNVMVFMARQVFFPKTSAWDNLQKSLKARFDDSVWDHLAGTASEPFVLGQHRRIAVKVIDERGNELMVVREAVA